jgi:hypothetical protein
MIDFWLYDIKSLFSLENADFSTQGYLKALNIVALVSIVVGMYLSVTNKDSMYFGITVITLCLTVLMHSSLKQERFTNMNQSGNRVANSFATQAKLVRAIQQPTNKIYLNEVLNFNKGDIIALHDPSNKQQMETAIISDIQYTAQDNIPVITLMTDLQKEYSKYSTQILKVSDSAPNIIPGPDPYGSISQGKQGMADPQSMAVARFRKVDGSRERNDYDLEVSTYMPGRPPRYTFQGPPDGPLKCRGSTIQNPMGTINVTEYDAEPTMYGTCNMGTNNNNNVFTSNQEATVSQRVDDLLFHKGNTQAQFSPTSIDTLPNDQEAFAHFCYRNPTNIINPKYAASFVNEPEKLKLILGITKPTGTEGGGGGGN